MESSAFDARAQILIATAYELSKSDFNNVGLNSKFQFFFFFQKFFLLILKLDFNDELKQSKAHTFLESFFLM